MRENILKKFKNVSHKWFYLCIKDTAFNIILNDISIAIQEGSITAKDAINLVSSFKDKEKAFIKLKHVKGKRNIVCLCELITKDNKKIKTTVSGDIILSKCDLLQGTPKKLKLYKSIDNKLKTWKKPNDDFSDAFSTPLDEEFTETGYYLYKAFQLELRRLNVSAKEYYKRFC
jgi:hypothetical protein